MAAALRPGLLAPFPQGRNETPRPFPVSVMARALAASTAETITPPAGSRFVIFSSNVDFYVNPYTTATVPGDTTDGTASELNPSGYQFDPNILPDLSVISAAAGIITAAFYA